VSEGIVDLLEAIHVDVQHRHAVAAAAGARDRLLQQMLELHAVRDLGQRIVAREVTDTPFGPLALVISRATKISPSNCGSSVAIVEPTKDTGMV